MKEAYAVRRTLPPSAEIQTEIDGLLSRDLFITHASNGATFTALDRQHLYRIKYQQADPDTLDEEVTAA